MFIGLFLELIKSTCVQSLTLLLGKALEDPSIDGNENTSFVCNIAKTIYVSL